MDTDLGKKPTAPTKDGDNIFSTCINNVYEELNKDSNMVYPKLDTDKQQDSQTDEQQAPRGEIKLCSFPRCRRVRWLFFTVAVLGAYGLVIGLHHDMLSPGEKTGTGKTTGMYVRWGRTSCGSDASLVYDGYMAGHAYHSGGDGANTLCLPKDPVWNRYDENKNSFTSRIYGLEIDVLDDKQAFGTNVLNDNLPCAVCKTTGRSAVLMVPAKTECYTGWTKEYSGYLVAQASEKDRTASEYICADEHLEALPGKKQDDNEAVLYPVEVGSCRTLNCPPYVEGRELTCVVCTQ